MSDRVDYFFGQLVTEAELDFAQSQLEAADRNYALDTDAALVDLSASPNIDGGIHKAMATSFVGFTVTVTGPGVAYDHLGRRIPLAANTDVSITATGETAIGAGGTPTGGSATDPGVGLERWISLFVRFDRLLSDPRVDANSVPINFQQAESFVFKVTMGTAAGSPTKPPLESGMLLLADFRRSDAAILQMDLTRRHDWLVREDGTTYPVHTMRMGNARAAIAKVLELIDKHVAGTADLHAAAAINYAGGGTWADATTNPATTVEAQLDKVISDLASTGGSDGTAKIGGKATTGSLNTTTGATSTTATTLFAQIGQLLAGINGRLQRGGDSMAGNITTDGTTRNLGATGAAGNRFNIFGNNLNVLAVSADIPTDGTARALGATGAAGNRFGIFANAIDAAGDVLPEADGTRNLGSGAKSWANVVSVGFQYDPVLTKVCSVGSINGRPQIDAAGVSDWVAPAILTTDTTRQHWRTTSALGAGTKGGTLSIPISSLPDSATITGISVVWIGQGGGSPDTLFYGAWLEANGTSNTRSAIGTASSTAGTAAIVSTSIFSGSVSYDRDAVSIIVDLQVSQAGAGAADVRVYCVNVTYTTASPQV